MTKGRYRRRASPTRRPRSCPHPEKKGQYATAEMAERAALFTGPLVGHELYVYLCPCGWFHLTKKKHKRQA